MSRHHEQAVELLAGLAPDGPIIGGLREVVAAAQVHATLAVADALGRLAASPADRLTAVVTGHSDAMAMVDGEIDRMLAEVAADLTDPRKPSAEMQAYGRREALEELRRRLHEVDEPAPGCYDCPAGCKSCTLDTCSCECYVHEHVVPAGPEPERCPWCDSPQPHLHLALVRPCPDPWHGPVGDQDPLAHVKVGDTSDAVYDDSNVPCDARSDPMPNAPYRCSRASHPANWQHIASVGDAVVAMWGGSQ